MTNEPTKSLPSGHEDRILNLEKSAARDQGVRSAASWLFTNILAFAGLSLAIISLIVQSGSVEASVVKIQDDQSRRLGTIEFKLSKLQKELEGDGEPPAVDLDKIVEELGQRRELIGPTGLQGPPGPKVDLKPLGKRFQEVEQAISDESKRREDLERSVKDSGGRVEFDELSSEDLDKFVNYIKKRVDLVGPKGEQGPAGPRVEMGEFESRIKSLERKIDSMGSHELSGEPKIAVNDLRKKASERSLRDRHAYFLADGNQSLHPHNRREVKTTDDRTIEVAAWSPFGGNGPMSFDILQKSGVLEDFEKWRAIATNANKDRYNANDRVALVGLSETQLRERFEEFRLYASIWAELSYLRK